MEKQVTSLYYLLCPTWTSKTAKNTFAMAKHVTDMNIVSDIYSNIKFKESVVFCSRLYKYNLPQIRLLKRSLT